MKEMFDDIDTDNDGFITFEQIDKIINCDNELFFKALVGFLEIFHLIIGIYLLINLFTTLPK